MAICIGLLGPLSLEHPPHNAAAHAVGVAEGRQVPYGAQPCTRDINIFLKQENKKDMPEDVFQHTFVDIKYNYGM
jgi:hypothetical protein